MPAASATVSLLSAFPEAAAAGEALRAGGLTVAVAESCTGGLLGAALTAVPGSSAYVLGGVIAYDNAAKVRLLGVDPQVLQEEGAVSEAVARAMAVGARRALGASIGLAVTGVAGPGESERKPAGLVFVAALGQRDSRCSRLHADLGREGNRAAAVHEALGLCIDLAEGAGP